MFEECFSMIELNALVERMHMVTVPDDHADYDFDELSFLLMQALDLALNSPSDKAPLKLH